MTSKTKRKVKKKIKKANKVKKKPISNEVELENNLLDEFDD